MREEPASEMLALRVPLHFILRLGARYSMYIDPDGPLHRRGRLLPIAFAVGDVVQGVLLARGRLDGRRGRILRPLIDTLDVMVLAYLAGHNRVKDAAGGAQLVAVPAVLERAYRRGAAGGLIACFPPLAGAVLGHLVARDRRVRPGLLFYPGVNACFGWALRVFEGWELRRREQAEELWRSAVEDDAFTAGRFEFIRRDSEGGQLLDLQGHAVNFLANVSGGRPEGPGAAGPKDVKAALPPGIPRAALLRGALHLHQRRRQPLRPSPADTLIPRVSDDDRLVLFDGEQLRRLEDVLLKHRPAGITTASVVDRQFLGQGTNYRIRVRAPRSVDEGPPIDIEVDLPTARRWRFEPVALGLVWQSAWAVANTGRESGDVPYSVTVPTATVLLASASLAASVNRRDGAEHAPLLSLLGFGPVLLMATVGARRMRRTHSPSGASHFPGLFQMAPLSLTVGFQILRMGVTELCATTGLTATAGWLSWRNAAPPRNTQSFVSGIWWSAIALTAGPFLRRAFDMRGERYAAGLNEVTNEAAEHGRIRGWQAMLTEAWRFQEEAERLAEQAQPADDYQRAFLERARDKLAASRELLTTLGSQA